MADDKLIGYVILKGAAVISGQRGKGTLMKLLKGSNDRQSVETTERFELKQIKGILAHIPDTKINELFSRLFDRNYIHTAPVEIGNYSYPMLFLSDEGNHVLKSLEKTEQPKLAEFMKQAEETGKAASGLGEDAVKLDRFIRGVFELAQKDTAGYDDGTDSGEPDVLRGSFLQTLLVNSAGGNWWTAENREKIVKRLYGGFREFLGSIPEKQAAVFRGRYKMLDGFYRPMEAVMEYYGFTADDIDMHHKVVLSKFFYKKWNRRCWIIRDIMELLFGDVVFRAGSEDEEEDGRPATDTYEKTYELFSQGKGIDEISRIRGFSKDTIINHLIKLVPLYGIDPYTIVEKTRVDEILAVAGRVGEDRLKPIKESLPEDFSYAEIKFALEISRDR